MALHVRGASYRVLDPDPLQQLAVWLAGGAVVVVTVAGPRYVDRLGDRPAGHESRHGRLCPPGHTAIPLHAIVLVEWSPDGFLCLDPYYPGDGQPIALPNADVLRIIAGEAAVVYLEA